RRPAALTRRAPRATMDDPRAEGMPMPAAPPAAQPATHPLDPLTAAEIAAAAAIVRRAHAAGPGWRFASIELAEPGKDELAAAGYAGPAAPRPLPRQAVA